TNTLYADSLYRLPMPPTTILDYRLLATARYQPHLSTSRHLAIVSSRVSVPSALNLTLKLRFAISSQPLPFSTASHVPRTYLYWMFAPSCRLSVTSHVPSPLSVILMPLGFHAG